MDIELRSIQLNEREILNNLWEKYDYEFSQYDKRDVNELGLYGCKDFDYYWKQERKWMYFVIVNGKIAGFVMLTDLPELGNREIDWTLGEFFIMYKYRRLGIGRQVFIEVLNKHKGRFYLRRHPKNIASMHFWDNVINEYTRGQYELVKSHPELVYSDGTLGDAFFFNS
jgi:predicted acetyltransferase